MSLEEIRRQDRDDWLARRAEMARGGPPAPAEATDPGIKQKTSSSSSEAQPETPRKITLEHIKALGRREIQGVKQELAAEKERERQRQVQLENERSKGRTREKGRFPEDDEGPFGWSR